MKKFRKLIVIIPVIFMVLVFFYKYYKFVQFKKIIGSIDYSEMLTWSRIYLYENNKFVENSIEFNEYIKKYNLELFNKLEKIEYYPIYHNNNFHGFYMFGFDSVNDSLNVNYNIETMSFFKSFFVKGDLLFSAIKLQKEYKRNIVYELNNGVFVEVVDFPILTYLKKDLGCDKIRPKDLTVNKMHGVFRVEGKDIDVYFSDFSNYSVSIIKKWILEKLEIRENKIYILNLKFVNFEDVECF
jgi:hypothetical protein